MVTLVACVVGVWLMTLTAVYFKGCDKGFREAGEIHGVTIVRQWRRLYGEEMPRFLWPTGTPDDADEQARKEIACR